MSLALGQARDQLDLYLRPSRNTAFVSTMLRQVDEFKNAGVTPQKLREFSKQTALPQLAKKTEEMSTIYEYYQALLSNRFSGRKGQHPAPAVTFWKTICPARDILEGTQSSDSF